MLSTRARLVKMVLFLLVFAGGCSVLGLHHVTFQAKKVVTSTFYNGTPGLFSNPRCVAMDSSGIMYVADEVNNSIRKITPAGVVSTLAGTGAAGFANGPGTSATFNGPTGVAVDSSGNLYVADRGNQLIRKITPAGDVSTLAGTPGIAGFVDSVNGQPEFDGPYGVAVDGSGFVYVADYNNDSIRKITPAGAVSTLAGITGSTGTPGFVDSVNGPPQFNNPTGVAVDSSSNVYVADYNNNSIRKITPAGVTSTLAGTGAQGFDNGPGNLATFITPYAVAVDGSGTVYVADNGNHSIRTIISGTVYTLAGTGAFGFIDSVNGPAQFYFPSGLALDGTGNVYVADLYNAAIRKVTPAGVVSTVAGVAGTATTGFTNGVVTALALLHPQGVAVDSHGNVYVTDTGSGAARKITPSGAYSTVVTGLNNPWGITVDNADTVYVSDTWNNRVVKVTSGGSVSTLVTGFNSPWGLATIPSGNVFVSGVDSEGVIEQPSDGSAFTNFAGSGSGVIGFADGQGPAGLMNAPAGIAYSGSFFYVADSGNNAIRKITLSGTVSTVAGGGGNNLPAGSGSAGLAGFTNGNATTSLFKGPQGVAVDADGSLYVADSVNNVIRKITVDGLVNTVAGSPSGSSGYSDGVGGGVRFNDPAGIAIDADGSLYVADYYNNAVRKITFQ